MAFLFWAAVIVGLVLVCILGYLLHSGLLYTPIFRVSHPTSMPRHVAYMLKQGPYKDCGPAFQELQTHCREAGTFGLYYDDPEKVAPEKCRYIVGCRLPDEQGSKLEQYLVKCGYKIFTFPLCQKAVITEFPDRNKLSMLLAVWNVYPDLKAFLKKHKLASKIGGIFEVYGGDLIRFYAPMEDVDKYYVPGVTPLEKKED